MDALHYLLDVFGFATALFLYLAPVITFKKIILKKSTEQFSGLPYLMGLLNCILSTWYDLPFVSPNNTIGSIVNSTSGAFQSAYVVFVMYALKRAKLLGLLLLVLTLSGYVALVSLLALHGKSKKLLCGLAASIFAIVLIDRGGKE